MTHRREWAATVRDACLRAAVEAYEDAGIRGLCAEGRFEVACDAIRTLDVGALVESSGRAEPADHRAPDEPE